MAHLLHLQASPRGQRSYSARLADAFLGAYAQNHPDDQLTSLNLFEMELPPFDGPALQAKYAILHGQEHSEEQRNAWQHVETLINQFKTADKYLLSCPMWNFSIPYRLKHYLDILVQPSYTFAFSPDTGYTGLVTGKPLCLLLARGGAYPPGSDAQPFDLQKRYLELAFGFIGFADIQSIVVEPTLQGGPDTAQQKLDEAIQHAKKLALNF